MGELLTHARIIPGISETTWDDWEKACRCIYNQVSDETIRIAVVGSIKSGKSTFINAFLKGDYLKRGAGVVTSIVTRIRKGNDVKATLFFKSWDEIHSDLEHAMVLLPSMQDASRFTEFDFRQSGSRAALQEILAGLGPEHLVQNGCRNENCILMTSYLKGFEKVKDIISNETVVQNYQDDAFSRHRDFVGDDSLAVYLKDIELEINAETLDASMEIADCQGSDSPNPLHLAMIQDYLLMTHLIIYVISSRTGLRQADIRFLSMIRKMGLAEHILFVVNCDFSEHESIDSLFPLIDRIREEISLIKPNPLVYTFSSLYNLFINLRSSLSEKDHMRLLQWQEDRGITAFAEKETERFMSDLDNKLSHERYVLLLNNPVERLNVIAASLDHWIDINLDILNRDSVNADEMLDKIRRHQAKILQLKSMMKSTLDGALQTIQLELRSDVNCFFDMRSGNILSSILQFTQQHVIAFNHYLNNSSKAAFSQTLYLVFQEFRHTVDTFVTENIMPEIIRFIREEETKIADSLAVISAPYDGLLQDALTEYNASMSSLGFTPVQTQMDPLRIPDLDTVKARIRLKLPSSGIHLRYSARIKTEAIVKLGCYTVMSMIKRLMKKTVENSRDDEILALQDGVTRMKRETERSIISHFRDYQENIKFQYILKLAEASFQSLLECLLDRFQAYSADISRITEWADSHQTDKVQISRQLNEMRQQSREIAERVRIVREQAGNRQPV